MGQAAAELALRWTAQLDELLSTVPEGKSGSAMLDHLCNAIGGPGRARPAKPGGDDLAQRCDREAIPRDPRLIGPRWREAQTLLEAHGRGGASAALCADRDQCRAQILEYADAIAAVDPDSIVPPVLRARLLVAEGKPDEAARLLGKTCDSTLDARGLPPGAGGRRRQGKGACAARCGCQGSPRRLLHGAGGVRQRGDGSRGHPQRAAARPGWRSASSGAPLVRIPNNEARWLQFADAASKAGAHAQAIEALEKVARRRGGADPALKRRIDAEHAAALGGYVSQPR